MAERGYYSLIQFVPNPGRAEGANVGLVRISPAEGRLTVRMAENNEAPKRFFRAGSFDEVRLSLAKEAMVGLVDARDADEFAEEVATTAHAPASAE